MKKYQPSKMFNNYRDGHLPQNKASHIGQYDASL